MAGEKQQYNVFSKKLLEHFPKPTMQEPLRFQLLGIRIDNITKKHIVPQSSTLDVIDRIVDPWIETGQFEDDGVTPIYESREIDIAYIASVRPGEKDSLRETNIQLGEIAFHRQSVGILEWSGQDRKEQAKMMFLFFCNRNEANINKPWHIPPRFGYIYKQISRTEEVKIQLTKDRIVDKAIIAIGKLSPAELDRIKKGLFPNDYDMITPEELESKLREIAKKTPEKILNLATDADVELNAFITDFERAGLIEFSNNEWKWGDTKDRICLQKPGQKTKFVALKAFFVTEAGADVLDLLEGLLKAGKKARPAAEKKTEEGAEKKTGAKNLGQTNQPKGKAGRFVKKNAPVETKVE